MTTALVVIDVQKGMFAFPHMQPFDGNGTIARINQLITKARKTEVSIIFVQHDGGAGHPLELGASGYDLHADLLLESEDLILVKQHCSAFQDTNLFTVLSEIGARHLIICGLQTEYCVDTTVRAAFEKGFTITLAGDAHSTYDSTTFTGEQIIAHHNQTLSGSFAEVQPSDNIIFG